MIDKNVILLGWVSFFTDLASAMINPILPIYVVTILHEGMDKLGIIVAVATFFSYILRIVSGYIADRYGIVKPLVVAGYGISAISKPLIGLTHSYKSVALLKGLERVGKGVRSAPKDLMISKFTKNKAYGKTFGFHKTLDIAGELSGTIILFLLLSYFGSSEKVLRDIFFATIIPGLIGFILVAFFVKDIVREKKDIQKFKLQKEDIQVIKSLLFYFLYLLFIFDSSFFTMQAKDVGIKIAIIPVLFIVSTATQTVTSYIFGVWIDRFGVNRMLFFAYVSGILAQIFLFLEKPIFTWIAFGFLGLFTVASLNANRAFIAKNAKNQGYVYGIFYAGVAIFGAISALIIGFIWEHFGLTSSVLYSLIGTITITLLFAGYRWRFLK